MTTSIEGEKATSKRSYKKHRRKEEIVANILNAARNNATKTRIMRTCYISYELVQKYLNYTTICGLLFYDSRTNKYHITGKGTQFLDYFHQYLDTESELVLKKRLISNMLENNVEFAIPNFESATNGMLTRTVA
ncbi:MAG TPA: winged helix-turn-helix domain-containing protein [Nitrososphaera sp.]